MLKPLLALILMAAQPEPSIVTPKPLTLSYALDQLDSLGFAVLLPELPEDFTLSDVRVQVLPQAREGQIASYTLVFVGKDQSFMLQSRPQGYRLNTGNCSSAVLLASRPFVQPELSWLEPQTLELLSPACAPTGQPLLASISHQQALGYWQRLHWYLPAARRNRPAHLLLFHPELQ